MKTSLSHPLIRFVIGSIRFGLGLILLTSGLAKLTHNYFPNTIGPPFLEAELAQYGLGLLARFVAFSQVTVGLLLITRRFATLGAIMAMPMLLTIWVVVVSLQWQGTPYVVGFLVLCDTILLAADFHKLKFILTDDAAPLVSHPIKRSNPWLDAANLAGMVMLLAGAGLWNISALMAEYLIDIGLLLLVGLGLYATVVRRRQLRIHRLEVSA